LLDGFTRVGASSTNIDNFSHTGHLCLRSDGTFFSDFVSNIDYTTVFGDGFDIPSNLVMFGTSAGNYTAQDNILNFTNLQYNNYGTITTAGISFPIGNKVELPERIEAMNLALDMINPRNNIEIAAVNRAKMRLKDILSTIPQSQPTANYSTPYQLIGGSVSFKFPIAGNPDVVINKVAD
jgi:hypothetical protein